MDPPWPTVGPDPAPTGERVLEREVRPRAVEPAAPAAAAADTSRRESPWLRASLTAGTYVHVGSFRDLTRGIPGHRPGSATTTRAHVLDARVNGTSAGSGSHIGPFETIGVGPAQGETQCYARRLTPTGRWSSDPLMAAAS
ncbi:MAG: hypothetical protein IPM94_10525, partial [bacterium]|nr:hypothetical protein [bacterium]